MVQLLDALSETIASTAVARCHLLSPGAAPPSPRPPSAAEPAADPVKSARVPPRARVSAKAFPIDVTSRGLRDFRRTPACRGPTDRSRPFQLLLLLC